MKKIKDMPYFLRPREKLKERGVTALSDMELIAVLIGSGTRKKDVLSVASQIQKLLSVEKEKISLNMLAKIEGVGMVKACKILAGLEISKRYLKNGSYRITCAKDLFPYLQEIRSKQQEHFVCFSLNGANEVLEKRIITVGLLNQSPVHPREVFANVISDRAASVIFAHNHPSGSLYPSNADINTHKTLCDAGNLLGIPVLDHIIVSKNGYMSFREKGIL